MRLVSLASRAVAVLLLAVSASVAADLSDKDVPLLEAIADRDVAAAQKAIADGANPSFMNDDLSPLSLSVAMGDAKMVDALLAAGADPTMKDTKGKTAIDMATSMHATSMLAALSAVAAKKGGAPAAAASVRSAPPAPAPVTPAPLATPTEPKPQAAAPTAASAETGTFDDLEFKTPDAKKWRSSVVDDSLVFASPLPPPDFCTLTVWPSRDCAGDDAAFQKTFDDLVQASLKRHDTVKIEKDTGPQPVPQKVEGAVMSQRVIKCEAKDFHTLHYFVAIHSHDRMQLLAYQSSGEETFTANQKDAEAFLGSINVVTKTTLNP